MLRLGGNFTIMMMVKSAAGPAALRTVLQPVVDDLELILHIDVIEAELHRRPVPDVRILVHGADRAGIVAQVSLALPDVADFVCFVTLTLQFRDD